MPKFGALPDPGGAHFSGIGGGKCPWSGIVFTQRACQVKRNRRMANKSRRINQRGPGGGQHVGRQSGINGINGRTGQDGPGGQKRGNERSMEIDR